MRFRVALLSIIILSNLNVNADIPNISGYVEMEIEEFGTYFDLLYRESDGGEILINLSETFIKKIACEKCTLSASINIFNTEGDVTEWAQIAGVNFLDLDPLLASKQKIYAAGLKEKINFSLSYTVRNCSSVLKREKIIFKFNDLSSKN